VTTIVFACIQNAGRSQMAAAFFNELADPARARALSAGTRPARTVHPEVALTLREVGIELGTVKPQHLAEALEKGADWLITMGCGEECPVVPSAQRQDWPLPDPAGQPPERVREIRDEIRSRVAHFVAEQGFG
jgi:arsenate reductase